MKKLEEKKCMQLLSDSLKPSPEAERASSRSEQRSEQRPAGPLPQVSAAHSPLLFLWPAPVPLFIPYKQKEPLASSHLRS